MRRKYLYFIIGWAFVFALYSFLNFNGNRANTKKIIKHFINENKEFSRESYINIDFPWLNNKTESIFLKDNLPDKGIYYKAVELLLKSKKDKCRTFPKDLNLKELFIINENKSIVFDFNEKMIKDFPGSTFSEFEFLNYIANNIFLLNTKLNAENESFKELNSVQFLSSGNIYNTISGHVDIQRPFDKKSNIINPYVNVRRLKSGKEIYNKLIQRICIDPGHGGKDNGVEISEEFYEKDINLIIAKGLKRRIVNSLGIDTILTRNTDKNISIDSRNSKANNQKSNLFISIHVNYSFQSYRYGAMTYINSLSGNTSNTYEQETDSENPIKDKNNNVNEVEENHLLLEWNKVQDKYITESYEVARLIQTELNLLGRTIDRKVNQLPLRVLSSLSMPAVLIEVGFASNRTEREKLLSEEYLNMLTNAVFKGIRNYISLRRGL